MLVPSTFLTAKKPSKRETTESVHGTIANRLQDKITNQGTWVPEYCTWECPRSFMDPYPGLWCWRTFQEGLFWLTISFVLECSPSKGLSPGTGHDHSRWVMSRWFQNTNPCWKWEKPFLFLHTPSFLPHWLYLSVLFLLQKVPFKPFRRPSLFRQLTAPSLRSCTQHMALGFRLLLNH